MASGLDEEDTSVDTVVNDVHAVDLVLSVQVCIEALLDVVRDWSPRLIVVDKVTEARRVNNGQTKANASLLDVGADGLDSDGLGENIEARSLALLGRVQRSVEKGVHQGRLSETRLTCWGALLLAKRLAWCSQSGPNLPTTMTLKLKPLRTLLRCHWFGRLAKPT